MASTPTYHWPTPDDVAKLRQGATAMRSLGNAIDASLRTVDTLAASLRPTLMRATGNATRSLGGSGAWGFIQTPTASWSINAAGVIAVDANGLVAQVSSYWQVDAWVRWTTNAIAGSRRALGIAASTAVDPVSHIAYSPAPAGSSAWYQHHSFVVFTSPGDRLGLFGLQDTGASLDITDRSVTAVRVA